MRENRPEFWLIAGPNGVGKTTFAFRRLKAISGSVNFVNLDEIARGLSPLDPALAANDAARIALARARGHIAVGETFALETTLAGHAQLRLAEAARAAGLAVNLLYFTVPDVETCLARIARRVAEGGHDVPPDIVRRRFLRSLDMLPAYAAASDLWRVYDTRGFRPDLIAEGYRGALAFLDPERLAKAHPLIRAALPA